APLRRERRADPLPGLTETLWGDERRHPAVRESRHPIGGAREHLLADPEDLRIVGDPDRDRPLRRLRRDRHILEVVEAPSEGHLVLAPELSKNLDPLLHARRAVTHWHAHG